MAVSDPSNSDDGRPTHLTHPSLKDLLQDLTPAAMSRTGEDVWYEIDGYDRSDLLLWIHMRSKPDLISARYFPLVRLELRGRVADQVSAEWRKVRSQSSGTSWGDGLMYGKGAFRSLTRYLEQQLPFRDFRGVYLESVHNRKLEAAAQRYGFMPVGEPGSRCFIKAFDR